MREWTSQKEIAEAISYLKDWEDLSYEDHEELTKFFKSLLPNIKDDEILMDIYTITTSSHIKEEILENEKVGYAFLEIVVEFEEHNEKDNPAKYRALARLDEILRNNNLQEDEYYHIRRFLAKFHPKNLSEPIAIQAPAMESMPNEKYKLEINPFEEKAKETKGESDYS